MKKNAIEIKTTEGMPKWVNLNQICSINYIMTGSTYETKFRMSNGEIIVAIMTLGNINKLHDLIKPIKLAS